MRVIRELAEAEWAELAEGILSLKASDGWPQLLELLDRVEQLAKDAAIDGKPEDLLLHRGWRDCAAYLKAQLGYLPAQAQGKRDESRAVRERELSPERDEEANLWGLASGDGPL